MSDFDTLADLIDSGYDLVDALRFLTPSGGVDTGLIAGWLTDTAPTGYLECDGSSLLRADYGSLFDVIGVTYGNVDGTHFTIPDFRGEFLRGWDNTKGTDGDAALRTDRGDGTTGDVVGSKQEDAIVNITGTIYANSLRYGSSDGVFATGSSGANAGSNTIAGKSFTFDASTVVNTGSDVRPLNVNIMWCIKT